MIEVLGVILVIGSFAAVESRKIFNSLLSLLVAAVSFSLILIISGIYTTAFFVIICITATIFSIYLIHSRIGEYEK